MVNRSDLDRIKLAAAKQEFRFRHAAGLDMPIFGETDSAKNAVLLVFARERVKPTQINPNPPIRPERKHVHGKDVMVISGVDLAGMKLTSNRLKDQGHIKGMDAASLITAEVESKLTADQKIRLMHVGDTK